LAIGAIQCAIALSIFGGLYFTKSEPDRVDECSVGLFVCTHRRWSRNKPVRDHNYPERRLAMKNGIVAVLEH